ARISVFDGTQPILTQVPPMTPWPIRATCAPCSAAVIAAEKPADPAPTTAISNVLSNVLLRLPDTHQSLMIRIHNLTSLILAGRDPARPRAYGSADCCNTPARSRGSLRCRTTLWRPWHRASELSPSVRTDSRRWSSLS